MSHVNENIRTLRNRMGLTQERLAELIGINRKALGAYEENRATPPLDKLNKMASLFGVTLDQLTQHRFAHDAPLFEENEVETPESIPEKKKPFSRTGPPVLAPIGSDVRYISHKYFDRYVLDHDFSQSLEDVPVFGFPFGVAGKRYRAFDVPADSDVQEGVIVGEQISLPSAMASQERVLLVALRRGIVLGRITKTAEESCRILLDNGKEFTATPAEVREVWFPVGFFARSLPKARPDLSALAAQFNAVKDHLDSLL